MYLRIIGSADQTSFPRNEDREKPMPVSDYGGHSQERKKGTVTKQNVKKCVTMRCTSCDHMQYVPQRLLDRAARVRCSRCGGCLTETEAQHKRRTGLSTKAMSKLLNEKIGELQYECRRCGELFRSETGLKLHILDHHEDF